ncbi:hypothetical protein DENSPDRAFT_511977 [Dentipellis sp. KUC8613]|nr:hypothetical protein DENSPDRAFT_511977 [Dentipellis sp. KUC8613]
MGRPDSSTSELVMKSSSRGLVLDGYTIIFEWMSSVQHTLSRLRPSRNARSPADENLKNANNLLLTASVNRFWCQVGEALEAAICRRSLDVSSSLHNNFSNDQSAKPLNRALLKTVGNHLLGDCKSDIELVKSLRATVLAHKDLVDRGLLYRAISPYNVLLVDSESHVESCYKCLFLDLDRASMTEKGRFEQDLTYVVEETQRLEATYTESAAILECAMAETVQFMAIELLTASVNCVPGVVYEPHHGLESILYALGYVAMTHTNRCLADNPCLTIGQRDLWGQIIAQSFGYSDDDDGSSSRVRDICDSRKGLNLLMFHHEARVGSRMKIILEGFISRPMRDLLNSARVLVARQTAFWILGGERTPMTYDEVLSKLNQAISTM